MIYDLIAVGGGVSGMVAAICAARRGKKVLILEKGERVGRKLLATGNGKCNLANTAPVAGKYNSDFALTALREFPLEAQLDFWRSIGLVTRVTEGRVYPYSEQASGVLNALRAALTEYGVETLVSAGAERIEGSYTVNGVYRAKELLLATGSNASFGYESLDLLAHYGHRSTPRIPALVPLMTDKRNLKGLKGIRARVTAALKANGKEIARTSDEILFKDNGVSGTAAFTLSGALARNSLTGGEACVVIDFAPEFTEKELGALFIGGVEPEGMFHKEIAAAIKRIAATEGAKPEHVAKNFTLDCVRPGPKELAQVMCGGLETAGFYPDTLESRYSPGLYAAGEALDVDGECGGFNLMWAVASGMAVGKKCCSK